MATSLVSPLTLQLNHEAVCSNFVLPKSPFLSGSKLFSSNMPCSTVPQRARRSKCFASAKDMSFEHIPKQFRGDNLKDEAGKFRDADLVKLAMEIEDAEADEVNEPAKS